MKTIENNRDTETTQVASLDTLKKVSKGDIDFVRESIEVYIEDMREAYSNMNQLLDINDITGVKRVAHKMKSSAAIVDADRLYKTLNTIELTNTTSEELNLMVVSVKEQVEETIDCLQKCLVSEPVNFSEYLIWD